MQILLVRDAQTPVRQITLTPWRLVKWFCLILALMMAFIMLANWLLEALGLDQKSQRQPISEAQYERKLLELEAQLAELNARLKSLDATRQQILQDQPMSPAHPPVTAPGGQGGPLIHSSALPPSASFQTRLGQLELGSINARAHSDALSEQLITLQSYKMATPTGYPLPYPALVASPPGYRMDPFTGQSSWHAGTDYSAYPGTPILATGDGYIIRAEWDDEFGNVVEISHPGVNMVTRYAHAQEIHVKLGQRVSRGDVVASVGSTGRSTGPHLHYEVR